MAEITAGIDMVWRNYVTVILCIKYKATTRRIHSHFNDGVRFRGVSDERKWRHRVGDSAIQEYGAARAVVWTVRRSTCWRRKSCEIRFSFGVGGACAEMKRNEDEGAGDPRETEPRQHFWASRRFRLCIAPNNDNRRSSTDVCDDERKILATQGTSGFLFSYRTLFPNVRKKPTSNNGPPGRWLPGVSEEVDRSAILSTHVYVTVTSTHCCTTSESASRWRHIASLKRCSRCDRVPRSAALGFARVTSWEMTRTPSTDTIERWSSDDS